MGLILLALFPTPREDCNVFPVHIGLEERLSSQPAVKKTARGPRRSLSTAVVLGRRVQAQA